MAPRPANVASVERAVRYRKLERHKAEAPQAIRDLVDWLIQEPELIAACSLGRHAEGSIRFRDKLMYELTPDELEAEALQELADAVCYLVVRRQKLAG